MSDIENEPDSDSDFSDSGNKPLKTIPKKQIVGDDDVYEDESSDEEEMDNDPSDSENDDISVSSDDLGSTSGDKGKQRTETKKKPVMNQSDADDDDESDDDNDDDYDEEDALKKLDDGAKHNLIQDYHPELIQHNSEEVEALSVVVRNNIGIVVDPLHKTIPILTKYEKARILGERAKQINMGAKPFVEVEENVIDGYLIALKELDAKKIPFIIKRPLPNGGVEYWRLNDLEVL